MSPGWQITKNESDENSIKAPMEKSADAIGMIAGNRSLPLTFAREARKHGIKRIVAVAFKGETSPELASLVDEIEWLRVGQLNRLIRFFTQHRIEQCVMLGQVNPARLFDFRPDTRALQLFVRLKEKNAHTIFGAIADELEKDGIELVEPTPWLQSHMPGPGFQTGRPLPKALKEDVDFGHRMAKEVSRLDIGQTVVVKQGTILAVEGFEGTDACLQRGGQLAGPDGGGVAVKVAKQNHDMRFDIPCIGLKTLETCLESGIHALAVEGHKTLFLEQDQWPALTRQKPLTVLTI